MTATATADRPRRGRPPTGAQRLSKAAIIEAAIALIDRDGLEAISMRNVAGLLGVDPKSLYHHVADKGALLDGVAEAVLSSITVSELNGDLRADLTMLANGYRVAVTQTHPRAAALVLTRPVERLDSLAPLELVLSVLLAAGATPEVAVHLLRTTLAVLTGTLLREADAAITFAAGPGGTDLRRAALDATGLPAISAAAPYLATCDHDAEFAFALGLVLDAVEAHLRRVR